MYDYVVKELPKLLSENFPQLDTLRASIFGHSMGGHGALTIYLKNLDKYKVFVDVILLKLVGLLCWKPKGSFVFYVTLIVLSFFFN